MTPDRIAELSRLETERFVALHPRSAELAVAGGTGLLGGVPVNWMRRWPGPFSVFVASASGATVTDVDGIVDDDFCLGDTGAMCGHSPLATVTAVAGQLSKGITTMLPTAQAHSVGRQLTERFGLPVWQIAMTATDANRFALRIAREVTGRDPVDHRRDAHHLRRTRRGHGCLGSRAGSAHHRRDPAGGPDARGVRPHGVTRRPVGRWRGGGDAAAAVHHERENLIHLACLNRGILLTPFHNMALMSPVTTEAMVDRHSEVFAEVVSLLTN